MPSEAQSQKVFLRQLVDDARAHYPKLPPEAFEKAKICLLDAIGAICEAAPLPWSRQAVAIARDASPGAPIIGTGRAVHPFDAAFANAVMGHGLVREDMHAGSISHHGVVVWPSLLALAAGEAISGDKLLRSAVIAYEAGCRIGRALFDAELARLFRPTGLVAPIGTSLGAGIMLGLSDDQLVNAMALAANTSSGLNQWPHSGSSEMYFHPGFAARSVLTCVLLAREGAQASDDIIEGEAGTFAAYKRKRPSEPIRLFADGRPEILDVYVKPAPACNFAQTACQVAAHIGRASALQANAVQAIDVRLPHAAYHYPGCNFEGPYQRALQAKMSIQFGVAAALANGEVAESNYANLDDPSIRRLISVMKLEVDPELTRNFPAKQGAAIAVKFSDGRAIEHALADVVPATPDEIRTRVHASTAAALGAARADTILATLASIETLDDVRTFIAACTKQS